MFLVSLASSHLLPTRAPGECGEANETGLAALDQDLMLGWFLTVGNYYRGDEILGDYEKGEVGTSMKFEACEAASGPGSKVGSNKGVAPAGRCTGRQAADPPCVAAAAWNSGRAWCVTAAKQEGKEGVALNPTRIVIVKGPCSPFPKGGGVALRCPRPAQRTLSPGCGLWC